MASIRINRFAGALPRIEPRLLSDIQAQVAQNCNFNHGILSPIYDSEFVYALPDDQQVSIYNYDWNGFDHWLYFNVDTDVYANFLSDDPYNRIYAFDGVKPRVKYTLSGIEQNWAWLGAPAPTLTPALATQAKTATTWTRSWSYWYEEPDGTKADEGTLTEGVNVIETTPGSVYTVPSASVPAKVTASAAAFFVMSFQAISQTGTILGRTIPTISQSFVLSDLFIDGARVASTQTTTGDRVLTLAYDTTETSGYVADRSYVYTLVNEIGEESGPSSASDFIGVEPDQDVLISNMDVAQPAGSYIPIVTKRIYRTVTGNAGTSFQFVAEIPIAQATYLDSLTDLDTGEVLPTAIFDVPSDELKGLRAMPGEFYVAYNGKTIYFSEQQYPYAWPAQYGYNVDDVITGIEVSGNTVIVGTVDKTYLVTAIDPVNVSIHKLAARQSCESKRSMISAEGMVFFASPDGICAVAGASIDVITNIFFSKEEWIPLNPKTMTLCVYEESIYVIHDAGMFSFTPANLNEGIITYPDILNGAIYTPKDDSMYVINGDEIMRWEGSATKRTAIWKSKEFNMNRPMEWSTLRDTSDGYNDTINIYANDVIVQTLTITNNEPRRIPKMRKEKFWAIEVQTNDDVQELLMTTSMTEV